MCDYRGCFTLPTMLIFCNFDSMLASLAAISLSMLSWITFEAALSVEDPISESNFGFSGY